MSENQETKKCNCELCKLSRALQGIRKNGSKSEKEALDTVWNRMGCAETDRDMLNFKLGEMKLGKRPDEVGDGFYVADRITRNPNEWEWTSEEQTNMARAVVWFSEKLAELAHMTSCYTK